MLKLDELAIIIKQPPAPPHTLLDKWLIIFLNDANEISLPSSNYIIKVQKAFN